MLRAMGDMLIDSKKGYLFEEQVTRWLVGLLVTGLASFNLLFL